MRISVDKVRVLSSWCGIRSPSMTTSGHRERIRSANIWSMTHQRCPICNAANGSSSNGSRLDNRPDRYGAADRQQAVRSFRRRAGDPRCHRQAARVTRERVRQIEGIALAKLRRFAHTQGMTAEYPELIAAPRHNGAGRSDELSPQTVATGQGKENTEAAEEHSAAF